MAGTAVLGRLKWHTAGVVDLRDETATARTLTFAVRDWPDHVAGQHIDLRLTAPDGYAAVRSYSIASAPNSDGCVEITVERLPSGEVSPYLTQEVMVGDELELRGPIGGLVRVAQRSGGADSTDRWSFRDRPPHEHDSISSIGEQHCAISIAIFRKNT